MVIQIFGLILTGLQFIQDSNLDRFFSYPGFSIDKLNCNKKK